MTIPEDQACIENRSQSWELKSLSLRFWADMQTIGYTIGLFPRFPTRLSTDYIWDYLDFSGVSGTVTLGPFPIRLQPCPR